MDVGFLPKMLQGHGAALAAVAAAIVLGCTLACCCIVLCAAGSGAAAVWWFFVRRRGDPLCSSMRSAVNPLEDVAVYLEEEQPLRTSPSSLAPAPRKSSRGGPHGD